PPMSWDFNDITFGFNGFFCQPGYDLVTGLGSPWAPWVVGDLVGVATPPGGAASRPQVSSRPGEVAVARTANLTQAIQSPLRAVNAVCAESTIPRAAATRSDALPLGTVVTDQLVDSEAYGLPLGFTSSWADHLSQRHRASLLALGWEDDLSTIRLG